ncbi:MAG: hypothetical protein ABW104_01620 [Candidatus Thiodiazotropha sp. 6PLUC2]
MSLASEADIFFSWEDASHFAGDEKVLREIDRLYFHFAGFASVEVEERSYERVYVDGFLRLYPADVKELKRGVSVTCSSALIDHHMSINGIIREELFRKFLVFDEELLIGLSVEKGENSFNYPADISFHQDDLHKICTTIGILPEEPEQVSPQSEPLDSNNLELDQMNVIGALACMLAMNRDLEGSLQDGQHISEIIIDDLFTMMGGLGVNVDGKKKFLYERLISKGVKSILEG